VLQEDYDISLVATAAIRRAKTANVQITKTIEECKALIASYYKAIEDFNNHMLKIRDGEIRRLVMEGTKEEKEQNNSLFVGVQGKPKSRMHQLILLQAKSKQYEALNKNTHENFKPVQ